VLLGVSKEVAEGKLNMIIFIILHWYRKPGVNLDHEEHGHLKEQ
jgi:hypothetical protein